MKYVKGSFITVPNKDILRGMDAITQSIFMWLCAYANETGKCFPSKKTLARDCGISESTVLRHIEKLIEVGVVLKQSRKKKDGTDQSNIYTVLIGGTESPHYDQSARPVGIGEIQPAAEPVEEDGGFINKVIDEFKVVNPSFYRLYRLAAQRQAAKELLKMYGFEKVKGIISILPQSNKSTYAPNITTPVQLIDNLGKLRNWYEKEKGKGAAKKAKVAFV